ncbi:MAG: MFS transporter [Bacteroidales bacterium]|nr:MFS transporter [Candidatus Physcousia equi]
MHSSLRSLNFWRVIVINLLVSTFVYMLMPLWPNTMVNEEAFSRQQSGWVMLIFCMGLIMPGPVASYLLDRFRRKKVCFWAVGVLAAVSFLAQQQMPPFATVLCRLMQGAAFSLFHIALGSTILIDITISERRNLAAYIYFWVCRFALALGPALGILALKPDLHAHLRYLPLACAGLAIYLIARIELPFRTPLRSSIFSRDRFWLSCSLPLVLVIFPIAFTLGIEMASNLNPLFYVYLFLGFVASMVLHFIVFNHADVRAEMVAGILAIMAAFLLLVTQDNDHMVVVAAALTGYGVGNVMGRVLSFLTVTSRHTERGSAQVTYKLTFEMALCIGFFLPCVVPCYAPLPFYVASFVLAAATLVFYLFFVHNWMTRNAKR